MDAFQDEGGDEWLAMTALPRLRVHHVLYRIALVDGGRPSGIVDWENAGFMPEYWDYTKAMRASSLDKDAQAIYRRNRFNEELEVERWLWRVFPFGGPEA
ncbi:hypothetical protein C8A01DRAFT_31972 [Parachaetomium inaequale]|uniref:Aminoglycoside phosphotransferase domain-containing protein n=1 Tax=Parachaetomium inaequale TaxID=2588326 RepID=A0AAN6PPZ8_9PEZI|nr:hypothetical protein C8A01DRAFT_31972 [Parachaetomium inaequale]